MYQRALTIPQDKSFFLFGPRGTGKTTWVKNNFPGALYIDLLEAELYNELLVNPQRLEKMIGNAGAQWIIVDEIQRIPALLHEVHRLIEAKKYRFILTGSSARKLRAKGVNLLAGRALNLTMPPLTIQELGNDFNLDQSLQFGHLPAVFQEADPKAFLKSYVHTYLDEEVRQEGLTRNMAAFARFMESASFSQGAVLNISEVARECSVERKVVEGYFSILEDLLIAYRVPVFTKKAKRKMIAHSKFFFFDVGVYRAIRPTGPLDRPEEIEGSALETLVFQELNSLNKNMNLDYQIYYWRTFNQTEVDFVLYGERGIKAFEVKRTAKVRLKELQGLKLFLKDYPMAKAFYLYGGNRYYQEGNIEIIPIHEALVKLPEWL
jgi:predicted AAA+ superfamily ATPase